MSTGRLPPSTPPSRRRPLKGAAWPVGLRTRSPPRYHFCILDHGASYALQREVMARGGRLVDVVEHLVEELRSDTAFRPHDPSLPLLGPDAADTYATMDSTPLEAALSVNGQRCGHSFFRYAQFLRPSTPADGRHDAIGD